MSRKHRFSQSIFLQRRKRKRERERKMTAVDSRCSSIDKKLHYTRAGIGEKSRTKLSRAHSRAAARSLSYLRGSIWQDVSMLPERGGFARALARAREHFTRQSWRRKANRRRENAGSLSPAGCARKRVPESVARKAYTDGSGVRPASRNTLANL